MRVRANEVVSSGIRPKPYSSAYPPHSVPLGDVRNLEGGLLGIRPFGYLPSCDRLDFYLMLDVTRNDLLFFRRDRQLPRQADKRLRIR